MKIAGYGPMNDIKITNRFFMWHLDVKFGWVSSLNHLKPAFYMTKSDLLHNFLWVLHLLLKSLFAKLQEQYFATVWIFIIRRCTLKLKSNQFQ